MQAALREAIAAEEQQKREEKILEDQAETHVEEKKAAEFKNKVQTVKKSHEVRNSGFTKTQSRRTWQRCNRSAADSATVSSCRGNKRGQERWQDGWKRHAQARNNLSVTSNGSTRRVRT